MGNVRVRVSSVIAALGLAVSAGAGRRSQLRPTQPASSPLRTSLEATRCRRSPTRAPEVSRAIAWRPTGRRSSTRCWSST